MGFLQRSCWSVLLIEGGVIDVFFGTVESSAGWSGGTYAASEGEAGLKNIFGGRVNGLFSGFFSGKGLFSGFLISEKVWNSSGFRLFLHGNRMFFTWFFHAVFWWS